MGCSTRADWEQALGALRGSVSRLLELTADSLTSPDLMTTLGELEVQCRRLSVAGHVLINQLATQATAAELGGTLGRALADRLRIVKADVQRRIAEADAKLSAELDAAAAADEQPNF